MNAPGQNGSGAPPAAVDPVEAMKGWAIVSSSSGRKFIGAPAGREETPWGAFLLLSPALEIVTQSKDGANFAHACFPVEGLSSSGQISVVPSTFMPLASLSDVDRQYLAEKIGAALRRQQGMVPSRPSSLVVPGRS